MKRRLNEVNYVMILAWCLMILAGVIAETCRITAFHCHESDVSLYDTPMIFPRLIYDVALKSQLYSTFNWNVIGVSRYYMSCFFLCVGLCMPSCPWRPSQSDSGRRRLATAFVKCLSLQLEPGSFLVARGFLLPSSFTVLASAGAPNVSPMTTSFQALDGAVALPLFQLATNESVIEASFRLPFWALYTSAISTKLTDVDGSCMIEGFSCCRAPVPLSTGALLLFPGPDLAWVWDNRRHCVLLCCNCNDDSGASTCRPSGW